jgi:hypothetical protein
LRAWAAYFDGALEEPPAFTLLDVKIATARIAAAPAATAKYLLMFTFHLVRDNANRTGRTFPNRCDDSVRASCRLKTNADPNFRQEQQTMCICTNDWQFRGSAKYMAG